MTKFKYSAISKDGKSITGVADASSREALAAMLAKQGVRPLVIKQQGGIASMQIGKPKVKSHDIVIFTRQLSTMVSAGVPLNRTLETLEEQATNKYFKTVIAQIAKDV